MTIKKILKRAAPALILLAGAALLARAATNEDCLACHGDKSFKNAAGRSMFVDPAAFAASFHGRAGVGCAECHSDLKNVRDFPHAQNLQSVRCASCHQGFGRRRDLPWSRIHAATKTPENIWGTIVRTFYIVLIAGLAAAFTAFIAADLWHRKRTAWKR